MPSQNANLAQCARTLSLGAYDLAEKECGVGGVVADDDEERSVGDERCSLWSAGSSDNHRGRCSRLCVPRSSTATNAS